MNLLFRSIAISAAALVTVLGVVYLAWGLYHFIEATETIKEAWANGYATACFLFAGVLLLGVIATLLDDLARQRMTEGRKDQ